MATPQRREDLINQPPPGQVRGPASKATATPSVQNVRAGSPYAGDKLREAANAERFGVDSRTAANDERYATVDQAFARDAYRDQLVAKQTARGIDNVRQESKQTTPAVEEVDLPQLVYRPRFSERIKKLARPSTAKVAVARAKVGSVTVGALSWAGPLWFAQFLFAILAILALGIMGLTDAVPAQDTGWFTRIANSIIRTTADLLRVFGFDLIAFAQNFYFISAVLILAIGLFTMMTLYVIYTLARIRCFTGEHAGFKMGMFLLALIGYTVPVVNMFPFVLFWIGAVWLYPR